MAQHESKRRENEIAFVMSRWQKVSSASSSLQNAATIVLNPQEKIGRDEKLASSRDGGRDSPSAVTLLEQSLTQADEGKHTLQEENVHLREVLGDVMTEIRATLSSINIDVPHLQDDLDNPVSYCTTSVRIATAIDTVCK